MIPRQWPNWLLAMPLLLLPALPLTSEDAQWEFNGNLESNTGNPPLVALAASPAVDPEVTFEGLQINGQEAEVARFSRGTYFEVPHGLPPNGGGAYINQFTIILDVLFEDRSEGASLTSLLQTNCCNQNDGDWFIGPDGGLGSLGVFGGAVPDGQWHRLALVVDLVAGTLTSFVDGTQVHQDTGQDLDGRFSLYSPNDDDPEPYETFFVFADDSGDNAEGYINSLQFHDLALSPGVIAEIGGPTAAGIPRDVCIFPPVIATRDIVTFRTPQETNADFIVGDVLDVEILLSDLRAATPPCTAPASVTLVETLPAGWTPSQISDGGIHDVALNTITWTVAGAALTAGKKLTYKITAAVTPGLAATFSGTVGENKAGAKPSPVRGESRLLTEVPFDGCGGIRCWNILGCFALPANAWPDGVPGAGDNPGIDHMRLDFLTDGEIAEGDFIWYPGAQIATAFGGDGESEAVSLRLVSGIRGANPNGVPEVLAWNNADSFINLNDDVYGGDPNVVMAYLQCYVNNPGPDREVQIGVDSDDSVQVILNDEEVWINSVPRGAGPCEFSDKSPDGGNFPGPITLLAGQNKLVLKVFEGGGGFNCQFRFEDINTFEPITDLGISKTPAGLCLTPPLKAARDVAIEETVSIQHATYPRWQDGNSYDVTIALSEVRVASAGCAAPTSVTIEEIVPTGWTPSAPSAGGVVNGAKITWSLTAGQLAAGTLSYRVKAEGFSGQANFRGKVFEGGSPITTAVGGETTLQNPNIFTDRCFITTWLLLGPYAQPGALGANPGLAAIRRDHLCDGKGIIESTVAPKAGDTVNTAYTPPAGGCARSTGLRAGVTTPINANDVPAWFAWRDGDNTINFSDYYGADLDRLMMYAVCYVDVAADVTVDIGLDSDDSVQVLLDGVEIWSNNVARAQGGDNAVVDVIAAATVAALNPLTAGRHKLMVKVFEGTGDHNFRLRFQDPDSGDGVCTGISICLDPQCADQLPPGTPFHRGDADANGKLELTDAIRVLNYLFLGTGAISCFDASDSDDNGKVELTDAVRILNYLFLGQGALPAPGPTSEPCGLDPTDEDPPLSCELYPGCN